MKSSYEVRAQKFIRQIMPYWERHNAFNSNNSVGDFQLACNEFCIDRKRKVFVNHGSTRIAIITSDYVVKIDYNENTCWGNSKDELFNWEKYYSTCCYSECFAPISKYTYLNHDFYIMPRIHGVGRFDECALQKDEDFWDWLCDNVGDIHGEQFGKKDDHFIFIDYACPHS